MTSTKKCNCSHLDQDAIYGKNIRLCNINEKRDTAVCTVCGTKHKN